MGRSGTPAVVLLFFTTIVPSAVYATTTQTLHEQIREENPVFRLQLAVRQVTRALAGAPTSSLGFPSRMAPADGDCGPRISRVPQCVSHGRSRAHQASPLRFHRHRPRTCLVRFQLSPLMRQLGSPQYKIKTSKGRSRCRNTARAPY